MSESEILIWERKGPIAFLILNRPEQRNSLSMEILGKLAMILDEVAENPDIAVLVIGANGKVFSAGHDLKEMVGSPPEAYRRLFHTCTSVMERIQSLPQTVIAMVQGLATAAGCQLVASCDLVVASEKASFATPGVKIGFFCTTPMVALTRCIGRKKTLEMLLTGEPLPAREALTHGLVNKVVPAENLRGQTLALASKIAESPLSVTSGGKRAFYDQIEQPQRNAYRYAQEVMSLTALAHEAQEGMLAFLEKRPPRWEKT